MSQVDINIHDASPELYGSLVVPESESSSGTIAWKALETEGSQVTYFRPDGYDPAEHEVTPAEDEPEPSPGRLTPSGYIWARANAPTSIVASLALMQDRGDADDWPAEHRETAVNVANTEGRKATRDNPNRENA